MEEMYRKKLEIFFKSDAKRLPVPVPVYIIYNYDRLIVYCVMKKMETIPDIKAKNFFHLCS